MKQILGFDISIFIALIATFTTIISSAITIIITKLFENYQNTKKHKRIVTEKILDTKIGACRNAIVYYGTYLNYLYSSKYTFNSLENYEYSKILQEGLKFSEELIKKIQLENNNEHLHILLFYDLYNSAEEKVAEEITISLGNYVEFINSENNNTDSEKERKLRKELVESMDNAIFYFRNKIKIVRDDLNKLL